MAQNRGRSPESIWTGKVWSPVYKHPFFERIFSIATKTIPFFKCANVLFSQHVDLLGFLDYEIWKSSRMLSQNIPLKRSPVAEDVVVEDEQWQCFGPVWNDSKDEKNNSEDGGRNRE